MKYSGRAATAIVEFPDSKILLVKRLTVPFKGNWALPGGRAHIGETVEQTLVREVKEETGLEVEIVRKIGEYREKGVQGGRKYDYQSACFLVEPIGGRIKREKREIKEIKLVDPTEIPKRLAFEHASMIKDYTRSCKRNDITSDSAVTRERIRMFKADYSRIAERYDELRPLSDLWIKEMIKHGNIECNKSLLEICCGTGRFTVPVCYSKGLMTSAIDNSIEMLRKAQAKDNRRMIHWVCADAHALPYRDKQFDVASMTLAIHQLENCRKALQEIYRILKNRGISVIMTKSHAQIEERIVYRLFPDIASIDFQRFPSISSLKDMITEIGFRKVHCNVAKNEETIEKDELIERVRSKYISTLTLLSSEQFEKGMQTFLKGIEKIDNGRCEKLRMISSFTFIVAHKHC